MRQLFQALAYLTPLLTSVLLDVPLIPAAQLPLFLTLHPPLLLHPLSANLPLLLMTLLSGPLKRTLNHSQLQQRISTNMNQAQSQLRSVMLGTGIGSDLECLSAKVVLLVFIQPLLLQMLSKAGSITWNGIQVGTEELSGWIW